MNQNLKQEALNEEALEDVTGGFKYFGVPNVTQKLTNIEDIEPEQPTGFHLGDTPNALSLFK